MKLVRYGQPGHEQPGPVDAGSGVRPPAGVILDQAPSCLMGPAPQPPGPGVDGLGVDGLGVDGLGVDGLAVQQQRARAWAQPGAEAA